MHSQAPDSDAGSPCADGLVTATLALMEHLGGPGARSHVGRRAAALADRAQGRLQPIFPEPSPRGRARPAKCHEEGASALGRDRAGRAAGRLHPAASQRHQRNRCCPFCPASALSHAQSTRSMVDRPPRRRLGRGDCVARLPARPAGDDRLTDLLTPSSGQTLQRHPFAVAGGACRLRRRGRRVRRLSAVEPRRRLGRGRRAATCASMKDVSAAQLSPPLARSPATPAPACFAL